MLGLPSPAAVGAAAANVFDAMFRGGLADLRRMPSTLIDEGPQRSLYRYLPVETAPQGERPPGGPVLLVPPLAAPAICFDLRRGCSVAEHLLRGGRDTYLVDYGEIEFADRDLGLEHWFDDVVPTAIRRVSEDAGGARVHLVGWCLGGILSALAVARDPALPVASLTLVGSPFDFRKVPLVAPLRPIDALTRGAVVTGIYRTLGGAPAPVVRVGYQLAGIDKYLMKPVTVATSLHKRDLLAQIEAVDRFMSRMHAYPGRTFGQLYHRFFRTNDLAGGCLETPDGTICLDRVRVPVLAVAGLGDGIAPVPACHHVADLVDHVRRPRRVGTSACSRAAPRARPPGR
jgi:polyhydroxyalkanoate synthase subunit PhaC